MKKIAFQMETKSILHIASFEKPGETTTQWLLRDGKSSKVPIINANHFRGKLRRVMAQRILDGKQGVSVDVVHLLTTLAETGKWGVRFTDHRVEGDPEATAIAMMNAKTEKLEGFSNVLFDRQNSEPFAALWGGGPLLLPSSIVTTDLLPVCNDTHAFLYAMTKNTLPDLHGWQTLIEKESVNSKSPLTMRRIDDLSRIDGVGTEAVDAEQRKEWLASNVTLGADRNERKNAKAELKKAGKKEDPGKSGAEFKIDNMMPDISGVVPGTEFVGGIEIGFPGNDATLHETMTAIVLDALIRLERFGGYKRLGWGNVHNIALFDATNPFKPEPLSVTQEWLDLADDYYANVNIESILLAMGAKQ